MSSDTTTSTRWRIRGLAVAGLATAATVGGLVTAVSAYAATAPTVTWTAPAQVVNDGSFSEPATLVVSNPAASAGGADITGATAELDVTGPSALLCSSLSVTGAPSNNLDFTFTGTNSTCTGSAAVPGTVAAGATATFNELVKVTQPGLTGSFTSIAKLLTGTTTLATSAARTTQIVNGTAPTFASSVPPAIVYHSYSAQFETSPGYPLVTSSVGSVYAFGVHKATDGTYSGCVTNNEQTDTTGTITGTAGDVYVALGKAPNDNGFVYDVTTGKIAHPAILSGTDWQPYYSWTLVANNGEGGASAATTGTACGTTALPEPALSVHDVQSAYFSNPVLFSDVSQSSTFANEIYTLAQQGAINGYPDGTYRPVLSVSRQAFAAILGRRIGISGTVCSGLGNDISPFPDVSNNSPFCEQILHLSRDGVINGYSNGTFHPGADISRQAIAAMFYRAYNFVHGLPSGDAVCTKPIPFNDVTAGNPFCGDIEWMASNHYANGYPDGGFHPAATTTRQANAAFVYRIFPSPA